MNSDVAFYTPMKLPTSPIPSGDIIIAQLIMRALSQAGYRPRLESSELSYQKRPSVEKYTSIKERLTAERERLAKGYRSGEVSLPAVWFTYHNYCKSPDHLGPSLSKEFGFPYVTAEACRTGQNTPEDWLHSRRDAQAAIRHAKINFSLKANDRRYLNSFLEDDSSIVDLPPFLDTGLILDSDVGAKLPFENDNPIVLTVGMMRPGKKVLNFRALAEALALVENPNWNFIALGSGPEAENIKPLFDFLPASKKWFAGSVAREQVFSIMRRSRVFVWPGIEEPIGMVYLESQCLGLPVVALDAGGVPDVVKKDVSGILVKDSASMASAIQKLIESPGLCERMGQEAKKYIAQNHSIESATQILKRNLDRVLQR